LRLKFGIIKGFLKAVEQNRTGFVYLCICVLSTLSDVKIKEKVFGGPQLRELVQDVKCEDQLSEVEIAAWESLHNVTTSFWAIVRQKTIVIWGLLIQNPTNLWRVTRL
jgi:hypothetical protein